MAVVPDVTGFECDESVQPVMRMPLFLVRVDGVIYDTGMSFTYNGPPDSGHYPYVRTTSGKCGRGCGNMCVEVVLGMFYLHAHTGLRAVCSLRSCGLLLLFQSCLCAVCLVQQWTMRFLIIYMRMYMLTFSIVCGEYVHAEHLFNEKRTVLPAGHVLRLHQPRCPSFVRYENTECAFISVCM